MTAATDKKHILIMDDTFETFLRPFGIEAGKMLDGAGINAEVVVARTAENARQQLMDWALQGIKPDLVSIDFLYGRSTGPEEYQMIAQDIYKDKPQLKPTKIFVHSKSGLQEYAGSEHARVLAAMKAIGAEYCHSNELFLVARKFGSDHDFNETIIAPSTTTFRDYLRQTFGINTSRVTRDEIEANREKIRSEQVGDNLAPYDAVNAVGEKSILPAEALRRLSIPKIRPLFETSLNNRDEHGRAFDYNPIRFKKAVGGAAVGVAAFNAQEVARYKGEGKSVILVLDHYTPKDAGLLANIDGVVLLGRGSSHLPVICENFGISGIFAQDGPKMMSTTNKTFSIQPDGDSYKLVSQWPQQKETNLRELHEFTIRSGDPISIETHRFHILDEEEERIEGHLYRRAIPLQSEEEKAQQNWWLPGVMRWADDARHMQWHRRDNPACHGLSVRANADTSQQAQTAFDAGADGIGLLRTEHMLHEQERLRELQAYMIAEDPAIRSQALQKLKAFQKKDFAAIFHVINAAEKKNRDEKINLLPLPVTVRLLDFKPDDLLLDPANAAEIARIAQDTKLDEAAVKTKIEALVRQDVRGAQFALGHKELHAMQAEALFEAAKETGAKAPEVMIPMIRTAEELAAIKEAVDKAAQASGYLDEAGGRHYRFGAMIETKEAVANAVSLGKLCDFFSFGTNDLTMEVTGLRPDDIGTIDEWINEHRAPNPFRSLAPEVQAGMRSATTKAREVNPDIKISVCGKQVAGDEASIRFCQALDLDSISVPANRNSVLLNRIIAGKEALSAYDQVRVENRQRKTIGGAPAWAERASPNSAATVRPSKERTDPFHLGG